MKGSHHWVKSIGVAYWVNIVSQETTNLVWVKIAEIEDNKHFEVIYNKLNRKKKIYQRYETIIIKLEQEKEKIGDKREKEWLMIERKKKEKKEEIKVIMNRREHKEKIINRRRKRKKWKNKIK